MLRKPSKTVATPPERPLANHPVLVLDCQATGPDPRRHRLLEMGWGQTSAVRQGTPQWEIYFLRLAPEVSLPHWISRITGLRADDLSRGLTPRRVWQRLLSAGKRLPAPCRETPHPHPPVLVIHYARYETPFLFRMHQLAHTEGSFPFQVICTHQIARRLYPHLPRMGLRALSGYLGHPMNEARRCGPHLAATAHIWQHQCADLAARGVKTMTELSHWLSRPQPPKSQGRTYPVPESLRTSLPTGPGVYRFIGTGDRTLYIGKAKSLKQRVSGYFQPRRKHSEHILEMLTQARDIHFTPMASALEAALTEYTLIGRQNPPYNIALRKTGRTLVPWTTDLTPETPAGAPHRRLGFFAPVHALEGLRLLRRQIKWSDSEQNTPDTAALACMLGVPPAQAPTPHEGIGGLKWLAHRHHVLQTPVKLAPWLALGYRLWVADQHIREVNDPHTTDTDEELRVLAARAAPIEDNELEADTAQPTPLEWSPEVVGRALEQRLAHWGRLIRRAHWFTLLSESTLAWQPSPPGPHPCRALIIASGKVHGAVGIPCLKDIPMPPGWRRSRARRLALLTAEEVIRMRVLTTEIKRLVADQRPLALGLGPNRIYDLADLTSIMNWL